MIPKIPGLDSLLSLGSVQSASSPLKPLITPVVSHSFTAAFLFNRLIPSPIDFFFQKISGLSWNMNMQDRIEGGVNVGMHHLPERVQHGTLVLERGVMAVTPLTLTFNLVMEQFSSIYADVVIILFDHKKSPISSWTVTNARPKSWEVGELDANSNQILINRMELVYNDITWLGVKL